MLSLSSTSCSPGMFSTKPSSPSWGRARRFKNSTSDSMMASTTPGSMPSITTVVAVTAAIRASDFLKLYRFFQEGTSIRLTAAYKTMPARAACGIFAIRFGTSRGSRSSTATTAAE